MTHIETPEEIITALQDRNLAEVSRRTKIPYRRIWKLARGHTGGLLYGDWYEIARYLTTGKDAWDIS